MRVRRLGDGGQGRWAIGEARYHGGEEDAAGHASSNQAAHYLQPLLRWRRSWLQRTPDCQVKRGNGEVDPGPGYCLQTGKFITIAPDER